MCLERVKRTTSDSRTRKRVKMKEVKTFYLIMLRICVHLILFPRLGRIFAPACLDVQKTALKKGV